MCSVACPGAARAASFCDADSGPGVPGLTVTRSGPLVPAAAAPGTGDPDGRKRPSGETPCAPALASLLPVRVSATPAVRASFGFASFPGVASAPDVSPAVEASARAAASLRCAGKSLPVGSFAAALADGASSALPTSFLFSSRTSENADFSPFSVADRVDFSPVEVPVLISAGCCGVTVPVMSVSNRAAGTGLFSARGVPASCGRGKPRRRLWPGSLSN